MYDRREKGSPPDENLSRRTVFPDRELSASRCSSAPQYYIQWVPWHRNSLPDHRTIFLLYMDIRETASGLHRGLLPGRPAAWLHRNHNFKTDKQYDCCQRLYLFYGAAGSVYNDPVRIQDPFTNPQLHPAAGIDQFIHYGSKTNSSRTEIPDCIPIRTYYLWCDSDCVVSDNNIHQQKAYKSSLPMMVQGINLKNNLNQHFSDGANRKWLHWSKNSHEAI